MVQNGAPHQTSEPAFFETTRCLTLDQASPDKGWLAVIPATKNEIGVGENEDVAYANEDVACANGEVTSTVTVYVTAS